MVKRLMGKDMWSGWESGRYLRISAFNPYNYQTGAVWPHDSSLIALGMRRYGFAAEAAAVARDISRAASHFLLISCRSFMADCSATPRASPCNIWGPTYRRPGRRERRYPAQAMPGLHEDAPRGKLYVDPALPDWLPDVTLTDLRLGRQRFDIRFWREEKTHSSRF